MVPKEFEPHPRSSLASDLAGKQVTMEEVAKHNKPDDCWIVIEGRVMDVTSYLKDHPGGGAPILVYGGRDVTKEFYEIHGKDAYEIKEWYCIGIVAENPIGNVIQSVDRKERALNPKFILHFCYLH